METLSPYAVLEVGIMSARDLTERESGFFNTDTTPDPFVQVLLDDMEHLGPTGGHAITSWLEKCKTLPARLAGREDLEQNAVVEIADVSDKETKLVKRTTTYTESKDRAMDAFQEGIRWVGDLPFVAFVLP
eukprot:Skav218411  [mRNA]  locus=scaffold1349:179023:183447:+ [translate_table: standard]